MKKNYLQHVEHMKKMFEYIAYGSLGIDMAITIVTLFSANSQSHALSGLQTLLNWALSTVFIVSAVLFVAIVFISHYEKIIDKFAEVGFRTDAKRRMRQRKLHHYR